MIVVEVEEVVIVVGVEVVEVEIVVVLFRCIERISYDR